MFRIENTTNRMYRISDATDYNYLRVVETIRHCKREIMKGKWTTEIVTL